MSLLLAAVGVVVLSRIGKGAESVDSVVAGRYDANFKAEAIKYGLDWKMLKAISIIESNEGRAPSVARGLLLPNDIEGSKSSDGKSWGLMQFTLPTARDFDPSATPEKLNNPQYSIWLAGKYFNQLSKIFFGYPRKTEFMVKSYNQGQGNTLNRDAKGLVGYADQYWTKYQKAYKNIKGV